MGLNTFEHKCMNHIDSFLWYFFVIMEIDICIILKRVVKILFKNF